MTLNSSKPGRWREKINLTSAPPIYTTIHTVPYTAVPSAPS